MPWRMVLVCLLLLFAAAEISSKEPEGIAPPNPVPPGVTPLTPASAGGMAAVPEMPPTPMESVPSYGQPGYSAANSGVGSSSASGFPPVMPTGTMAAGPQPRQALRILVRDEGGAYSPYPCVANCEPTGCQTRSQLHVRIRHGICSVPWQFPPKVADAFLPPPAQ